MATNTHSLPLQNTSPTQAAGFENLNEESREKYNTIYLTRQMNGKERRFRLIALAGAAALVALVVTLASISTDKKSKTKGTLSPTPTAQPQAIP